MEEDPHYNSVVFNNRPTPQTVNLVKTVYSEITEMTSSAPSAPAQNNTVIYEKVESVRAPTVLTVVSVCLCVLLLGSIAGIIYLSLSLTNQSSENKRLSSEMSRLQNSTELLMQERDSLVQDRTGLNWILQVIMSFRRFPVTKFCPQNQCRPCLEGWIRFENSCYLFYETKPQTWSKSRSYCKKQNSISDLVIIDSQQEQEFIHDRMPGYDNGKDFHGYWIGLSQQEDHWVWVDRQTDSLRFWMKTDLGTAGPKALVIPKQSLTSSWASAQNSAKNRFICESKALTLD